MTIVLPGGVTDHFDIALNQATFSGTYHIRFRAHTLDDKGASAFSFGFTLAAAPSVNFIPQGAASTPNCPGTAATPEAAAGQLCVYEQGQQNVKSICIARTGEPYTCGMADRYGASVAITAINGVDIETGSFGSWAVTAP